MNALFKGGGANQRKCIQEAFVFQNKLCDEFQGGKTRVTKQIKDSWAPLSMGAVHYLAYKMNLAIQPLIRFTFLI